jgi:hypothetical protein
VIHNPLSKITESFLSRKAVENGLNGPYGYNGPNGRIEFQLVDKIPW